jgi:hypothetical protein
MRVAFILLLASAFVSRADENAAGRWEGTVQDSERELELIVDLAARSGDREAGKVPLPFLDWELKVRR